MELKNYSLKINDNVLFKNVNITFEQNIVHHILGKNGSGKSSFAKSALGSIDYKGVIDAGNIEPVVIGSYTNIPNEYRVKDILDILENKYTINLYKEFKVALDIDGIPCKNKLENLSDGQKQKLKLLFFMSNNPKVIILDEFTTALDKKTSIEIYKFLNNYIKKFESTIINITHNLSDLKGMPGMYYVVDGEKILGDIEMSDAIDFYVNGVNYEE